MRFKILVANGETEWREEYVKNTDDPEKWARDTMKFFNSTRSPDPGPEWIRQYLKE